MKHDLGALAFSSMVFLVTFVLIATAERDFQLLSGGAAALGLFAAFYWMLESYLWLMTRGKRSQSTIVIASASRRGRRISPSGRPRR